MSTAAILKTDPYKNFTTFDEAIHRLTDLTSLELRRLPSLEKYFVSTIAFFALVFVLGGLKQRYGTIVWLKLLSYVCYLSVPSLITYILGLMAEPANAERIRVATFSGVYSIWAIVLLLTYASFDNLSAFNLEEINGRSKLLFGLFSQFVLLLILGYTVYSSAVMLWIVLVFLVMFLKFAERLVALAHAAGVTPGIKDSLRRIISFMNDPDPDHQHRDDQHAMLKRYLVGPRFTKTKRGKIVDGITLEKIWGCSGRLLSLEPGGGDVDGQLKDTCLSFALFWLLIGKIRGYPNIYAAGTPSRNTKAWTLVRHRLLSDPDRAFRVVEVELSFLQDYFYSKYMFFYLNGFYWKLISLVALPIMLWRFALSRNGYNFWYEAQERYTIFALSFTTSTAFTTVILILYSLEVIQLYMYAISRWFKVILLCLYAKIKVGWLRCCIGGVIRVVCLCTLPIFSQPWKRELDQYSLLESCTNCGVRNTYLDALTTVCGFSLPKPGMKQGTSVPLSKDLKTAVVVSLQNSGPSLSNGVASLAQNDNLSWACKLNSDAETILVWHIATSICELQLVTPEQQKVKGFEVATQLSKYCAYLLAFAPLLISVPVAEAELICENVVGEARDLLKEGSCLPCGKAEEVNIYDRLKKLSVTSDKEASAGGEKITTLQKGVRLGEDLLSLDGDGTRWKLLAEFWAEMVLFLAPSNHNEMAHAEKLAIGGEFITHLWALLIHAGIVDRNNSAQVSC